MLQSSNTADGRRYFLTMRAMPYYFDRNDLGHNPERAPYLCYSTVVPQRVTWTQPVHVERDGSAPGNRQVFRAAFE